MRKIENCEMLQDFQQFLQLFDIFCGDGTKISIVLMCKIMGVETSYIAFGES